MFLKADNSENAFKLKAMLNVETKQNLRNALYKKTDMLNYLLLYRYDKYRASSEACHSIFVQSFFLPSAFRV